MTWSWLIPRGWFQWAVAIHLSAAFIALAFAARPGSWIVWAPALIGVYAMGQAVENVGVPWLERQIEKLR